VPAVQWFFPFFRGLALGVVAMLLHEGGHLLGALALGIRVKRVGIKWNKGIYTVREAGSPGSNLMIAVAGPMMNVLLFLFWPWSLMFGLANLCYAVANLLPIEGSDGSRILDCWMQLRREKEAGMKCDSGENCGRP